MNKSWKNSPIFFRSLRNRRSYTNHRKKGEFHEIIFFRNFLKLGNFQDFLEVEEFSEISEISGFQKKCCGS
jgi:hypothetical protein